MHYYIKRFSFTLFLSIFLFIFALLVFLPIFNSNEIIIPFSLNHLNICDKNPKIWFLIKITYCTFCLFSCVILSNSFISYFFKKKHNNSKQANHPEISNDNLNIFVGINSNNENVYIPEKGLFQNILVTGTIGSGKTSSFMYPITKQLINYESDNSQKKLGMLILDVKGNYHSQVRQYVKESGRENDLIIIELGGNIKYNPLHKPNLKPSVLANRLKTILTLFSPNNSESYWLDKAEQVLLECIKLCRLYNNNYVTFLELHKLINIPNYYLDKINSLKETF